MFVTTVAAGVLLAGNALAGGPDRLKSMQTEYVRNPNQKAPRAYHFGSQGPGGIFTNHGSHTNRLVPVYTFGRKVDLASVSGVHSRYRDPRRVEKAYGFLPANTVNPEAEYADQSDLYKIQKDAIDRGLKHLFIVWFDGTDWQTQQAAAVVKTGRIYTEGKGSGLIFQDYTAQGSAQYGYVVTSPTHDQNRPNVDTQTVQIPKASLGGGYDALIAGPSPWQLGRFGNQAPGYFKGQSASPGDRRGVEKVGRVLHAYTDSSQSAGEMISGVKSYNNGLNVADDGRLIPTLFHELEQKSWKLGTVTSVPFDHASPAGMYAQNVYRDDYQDLAREMLGLKSIVQEVRGVASKRGLDVVMGTGYGINTSERSLAAQGKNGVPGSLYITAADLKSIDVRHGGQYVVVHTEAGKNGSLALQGAAVQAARASQRLFGFFGRDGLDHLPYQTADGGYDPAPGMGRGGKPGEAEVYAPADRLEQPTLAQMSRAAIQVLAANPDQPFALFIEAGDVDFALHANNLDNAIGAVLSGEEAVRVVIDWVEQHSNWDESALIVSSDHGHYLVIDNLAALAGKK